MTETPANTPKPIGNTSNFFPGGLKGVAAAPAFSALAVGGKELEDWSKGTVEDGGGVTSGRSVPVLVLSGAEPPSQAQVQSMEFGLLHVRGVTSDRGTEVRVIESTTETS